MTRGPVHGDAGTTAPAVSRSAARGAAGALAGLALITVAWWVLALWPVDGIPPTWLVRARQVCFDAGPSGLPGASGWILLIGQPIGMFAVLMAIAGDAVRASMARARATAAGRTALAAAACLLLAGAGLAGRRVHQAPRDGPWSAVANAEVPASYPRLARVFPPVELVDQRGNRFGRESVRGRPTLLTFGFGHCRTVCPLTVENARRVRDRFMEEGREVALVVVTLDPWRDTPARLPALARQFHLDDASRLLSGSVEGVNAALDALEVPRERVRDTGDIVHPALVYVLDADGTIAYAASAHADLIEELVRRL